MTILPFQFVKLNCLIDMQRFPLSYFVLELAAVAQLPNYDSGTESGGGRKSSSKSTTNERQVLKIPRIEFSKITVNHRKYGKSDILRLHSTIGRCSINPYKNNVQTNSS